MNNFLKFTKNLSKSFEPILSKIGKRWHIVEGKEKIPVDYREDITYLKNELSKLFKNEEVPKKDWSKIPKNKYVKIVLTNGVTLFGTLNQLSDAEVTESKYSNITGFYQTLSKRLDTNNLDFYKKVFTVSVPANNKIYRLDQTSNTFKIHVKFLNNGINKIVSVDNTDEHLFITSDNQKPSGETYDNIMEIFDYQENVYIYKIYQ